MTGQRGNQTNPATSARTATCKMLVPLSKGEATSLASIRSGWAVRVGSTTYPTRWHVRGASYIDNSLRYVYATWRQEVPAGVSNPTAPTIQPEVIEADNSATAVDGSSFATWASELNITVAYTDDDPVHGNTVVSENIGALARANTLGNSATVVTSGGVRYITYHAWIGPGRRHGPVRQGAAGNSANGALNLYNGLLHVVCTIEVRDEDSHCQVGLALLNDAAYPYPSAPHDGGARRFGQPDRPTHLNPAETNPITGQTEQLERPLRRYIDGLTVTIAHGSTTLYSRPWYVSNHTSGAGPYGTITSSGNGTTSIPIQGLGDRQGWAIRFAVSSVDLADAEEKARHPYQFTATPTYETWLATTNSRTFASGTVAGDTVTRRGWIFSLPRDIPASTFTRWWGRNNTPSAVQFMSLTRSTPWAGYPDDQIENPNRGGKHYIAGFLHEGEAVLAGCPEFLYRMSGWSLRMACRPFHLEHEALNALDLITDTTGRDRYYCQFSGSQIGDNDRRLTYSSFGRLRVGADTGFTQGANYNGTVADTSNPDPTPATDPVNGGFYSGPNWGHFGSTHIGARPLFLHALLTDDPMSRYLLTTLGHLAPLNLPGRTWLFAMSPYNQSARGEVRPIQMGYMAYLLSDDTAYRARIRNHIAGWRCPSWSNENSNARWRAPGAASNQAQATYPFSACGIRPHNIQDPSIYQWWLVGQVCEQAMDWSLEAETDAQASAIAGTVAVMSKAVVDFGFWVDPTRISAAATRAFDECWTAHAAITNDPLHAQHGVTMPKHSAIDRNGWTTSAVRVQNLHADVGVRSDAQTMQQWPALPLSMVFAQNRNAGGHTERVTFLRNAMRAIYPELPSGIVFEDSPEQHLGMYTGDSYVPNEPGNNPPVPRFTADAASGFIPWLVTFDASASSYVGAGASTIWRWYENYTGPSSVVTQTINGTGGSSWSRTYNTAGTYTPALELEQADGQRRLFVLSPPLNARQPAILAPIPSFTVTPTSALVGETFSFVYTELGGRALTYVWEYRISGGPSWTTFGAGLQNPTLVAPSPAGLYDVRCTASNESGGNTTTVLSMLSIAQPAAPPTPTFAPSATQGIYPLTVTLDASASTYTGTATWAWWDHYDPAASPDVTVTGASGATRSVTYTEAGRFFPALQLTQADGQSALFIYSAGILAYLAPVGDAPEPDFYAANREFEPAETEQIRYVDRGTRALSWVWETKLTSDVAWTVFGGGAREPVWAAELTPGTYDVRVTATNEFGSQTRTRTAYFVVSAPTPPPVASFTVDETLGTGTLAVAFDASASTYEGAAGSTVWAWYADASQSSPTQTINGAGGASWSHTYTEPGSYLPMLRLTQADAQADTFVLGVPIIVVPDPSGSRPQGSIGVSVSEALPGEDVTLTWVDTGIPATSFAWYWQQDGESEWYSFSTLNPSTWTAPNTAGDYLFRCEATNDNGTTTFDSEVLVTVTSGSAPTAAFTLEKYTFTARDRGWPTPTVEVATNTSTGADTYTWELFGWESHETIPTNGIQAPGLGTHVVRLTASNSFGSAIAEKRVTVLPRATLLGDIGAQSAAFDPAGEIGVER